MPCDDVLVTVVVQYASKRKMDDDSTNITERAAVLGGENADEEGVMEDEKRAEAGGGGGGGAEDIAKEEEEEGEDEDEIWYAARDGSYFVERRLPFFYLNLCCYVISVAFFLYMAVVITEDFVDQQKNPPTTTKIQNDVAQPFPGILLCNLDDAAPLDLLLATFNNNDAGDDGSPTNISDRVKPVECGQCLLLEGTFPAFESDDDASTQKNCAGKNSLSLVLNVNVDNYSNSTPFFVGVEGFLFAPNAGEEIAEAFCNQVAPRCQTLAPSFEDCPKDLTRLSFEPFRASARIGTFLSLTRSETQHAPRCDQTILSWNPVTTTMEFNSIAIDLIAGSLGAADGLVVLQFEFSSPQVAKTTYNPISGQSMFGSLSGWFGFLTDGWGVISIVFFFERTFLFLKNKYFR